MINVSLQPRYSIRDKRFIFWRKQFVIFRFLELVTDCLISYRKSSSQKIHGTSLYASFVIFITF